MEDVIFSLQIPQNQWIGLHFQAPQVGNGSHLITPVGTSSLLPAQLQVLVCSRHRAG